MSKYLAKIIANDQEGLQMISACSSGAKVKVTDIKYLASNKVFLLSIERTKIETNQEGKKINSYEINLIFNNNAHIALTTETIEARLEDQNEIK